MRSPAHRTLSVLIAVWLAAATPAAQPELVIVREATKEYHRATCEVVRDGRNVVVLTRAQAESRGYKAHPACEPAAISPEQPAKKRPAPVYVYVDTSKYYHRDSCAKLGRDKRKVELQEAGRKYWPCARCKPPIRQRRGGESVRENQRDGHDGDQRGDRP